MLLPLTLALAADPVILDAGDARYYADSRRGEAAAAWYLERLDEHLVSYVELLGQLPSHRSPALVGQIRQWQQDHPDDTSRGPVALAIAHSYAGHGSTTWMTPFSQPGAWCDDAEAALATLPDDGPARYRVLRARFRVADACGTSSDDELEAARALALSGEAGPYPRAWFGLEDGVDDDDLVALKAAVEEATWHLEPLARAFADDWDDPALEEVRAYLLEQARALATSDRPAHVDAAITVLSAADEHDEARAAREHLATIDPGNEANRWQLDRPSEPPGDAPVDPATIVDPAERLAALREAPVPAKRWARVQHWAAIADAAEAVGDIDAELDALAELWPIAWGTSSNVRYARTTVAAGRDLKKGAKAADHAVAILRDPRRYQVPKEEDAWREQLADALDARALVAEARGRRGQAVDDLEEALLLAGPTPDRLLRLGLLYDDAHGVPLLARAAAQLPPDTPGIDEATERIAAWLATQPGWQPDAATYIAAARPAPAPDAPAETFDNERFVDLVVQIDGEARRLFDIEGPLVVDVWATWCGPCMGSLPHLDALARRHEGEVTFLAVSVDAEEATAARYLDRRGEHAFTAAFLGKDGMDRMGISGIPAMFVFDGDHQLVAKLSGWGPGNTQLDEAIERMLADR